jgi:tripartite-type tricarboxylate transporter receptor subunit TctC
MSLEPTRRGFLAGVGALPLLGITCGARAADAWPNRPVKMIVSYPAGGANDLVARSVSTAMERALNATVIVDNRSGAAGVIGAEAAAKAPPDGYTLYMMSSAQVLAPSLRKTLPYDPVRDFTAIALSARSSYVLAVHPSVPLKTMAELIGYAKANPGKLNYASSGVGAGPHLATELFASMADVKLTHVPYRGDTPALTDLVAGQVQMSFMSIAPAVPHVKSGALRALAVASAKRFPSLPDVPTVAEAGVPTYEAVNWWGIVAPAGTPQPIIDKLHAALTAAQDTPEVEKQFASEGATVVKKSPAEFGAFMVSEMNKWEQVVKKGGIKAE